MISARHQARIAFLQQIKKQVPDVLYSLENDVFPSYEELSLIRNSPPYYGLYEYLGLSPEMIASDARFFEESIKTEPLLSINSDLKETKLVLELQNVICKWAKKWGLVDEWCISEVLNTLIRWRSSSVTNDWAYSPEVHDCDDYDLIFSFSHKPWNTGSVTWTSYSNEINESFKQSLLLYKKEAEAKKKAEKKAVESDGYIIKREKDNKSHHFAWLVDFQIKKLRITKIASNPKGPKQGIDYNTVSEAIKNTAALLGLTLRPLKRGRSRSLKISTI